MIKFAVDDHRIGFKLESERLSFSVGSNKFGFGVNDNTVEGFGVVSNVIDFAPDLVYQMGTSPIPAYRGAYTVIPSSSQQVLNTGGYRMTDNVTVKEIPYAQVTNVDNGWTVTIGG